MQRSLRILIALLLSSTVGWSADYKKGYEAYYNGDYATALRELKPLAAEGDAKSQHVLGRIYEDGKGVPQNYKTAFKWFRLVAEQRFASAQYLVGRMYYYGKGVPKNYKKAFKWFTLSAERGVPDAQFHLGVMYNNGQGVAQNLVYAYMWYNVAASEGVENAVKARDLVAKLLTRSQIAKAQELAVEYMEKKFKGCD